MKWPVVQCWCVRPTTTSFFQASVYEKCWPSQSWYSICHCLTGSGWAMPWHAVFLNSAHYHQDAGMCYRATHTSAEALAHDTMKYPVCCMRCCNTKTTLGSPCAAKVVRKMSKGYEATVAAAPAMAPLIKESGLSPTVAVRPDCCAKYLTCCKVTNCTAV